jgi:PIN domain nuclease of toxin-antitoxin system
VRTLLRRNTRLYVSPATLLEIQFLQEAGKIRLKDASLQWITEDDRWLVDEPPSAAWFLRAVDVLWTRDPFDRLLVAQRWSGDGALRPQMSVFSSISATRSPLRCEQRLLYCRAIDRRSAAEQRTSESCRGGFGKRLDEVKPARHLEVRHVRAREVAKVIRRWGRAVA